MTDKSNTQAANFFGGFCNYEEAVEALRYEIGGTSEGARDLLTRIQDFAAQPTPEPVVEGLVMVDMVPPATARDRWMYEQGRLAERDARTHAIEAASSPVALQGRDDFEVWWEKHGQFCRAGGGDYEKSFAFSAWQARASLPAGGVVAWPKKATPEMLTAFKEAFKAGSIWTDRITRAVEAMLEAAPQPSGTPASVAEGLRVLRSECHKVKSTTDGRKHAEAHALADWVMALCSRMLAVLQQPSETQGRRQMTDEVGEALRTGLAYVQTALEQHDEQYRDHPATSSARACIKADIEQIEAALHGIPASPQDGGGQA